MNSKIKEYEELGIFLFPIVTMFIAPYIHEYIHVWFLNYFRCPSNHFITFSLYGICGYVEPLCQLTKYQTFVMLIAPVTLLISFGILLFGLAFHMKMKNFPALPIYLSSTGMGFIVSSALDFFSNNCDFKIALSTYGVEVSEKVFYLAGIVIIIISSVFYLEVLFEISREVRIRKPTRGHK